MSNFNEIMNSLKDVYVIAEIGANHNGSVELAKELILKAKKAGAHAVKFQSWTNKSLVSEPEYRANQQYHDDPKKHFGSLREMVEKYMLTPDQHFELRDFCIQNKLDFCSTPFSQEEVDLLESLDVPFYKIASMDITNHRLLRYVATKGRPLVLSTGMATLGEIEEALDVIYNISVDSEIYLLHCTSLYPPDLNVVNLRNIPMLRQAFDLPVGYSDHTIGTAVSIAAIALGSRIIEKHFTLDKDMEGWDHAVSASPHEMNIICAAAKDLPCALGGYKRVLSQSEVDKREKFRRSAVYSTDLLKGHVITLEDILYKRPGSGIPQNYEKFIVGKTLLVDVKRDELVAFQDIG